jgi:hypothetical protein
LTAHPAPANLLAQANLDAQGGLNFLSANRCRHRADSPLVVSNDYDNDNDNDRRGIGISALAL